MSTHAGEDDQGSSTMAVRIPARGIIDGSCHLWDDGAYSNVKRILINHGVEGIHSVQIEYIDQNGEHKWGAHHCRNQEFFPEFPRGLIPNRVELDYPSEYLTSIHGYYTDEVIKLVTFESNRRTWGPYGKEEGIKFSFPILGAKIVGFHGFCKESRLIGIGVYVQPITKSKHSPKSQVLKPPKPEHFSLGVYGREEGEYWSHTFVAIKRFVINHDREWIISIQMEYVDENGKSMWSEKHGGDGGTREEVVLEYPGEYLVTIEGCYDYSLDSKSATDKIQLLTVITNKKTRTIVGVRSELKFTFPSDERLKVVGIHGRSDNSYLNSIGLYAVLI